LKRKCSLARFAIAVIVLLGVGWVGWQLLLARTAPAVHLLPSMIQQRLTAHGGAWVPLSGVPAVLQQAVVATEDAGFWTNPGIDPKGIARSVVVDVLTGSFQQGGSTITQQLARDMLLNPNKTLWRKAKEMLLALVITHYYSKDAILAMYLNEVYLGHGAYGLEQAARVYFGVAPEFLTPAQCVMLAGLPRGPSLYDPLVNFKAARDREREVLDNMVEAGYIGAGEANRIYAQPLGLSP